MPEIVAAAAAVARQRSGASGRGFTVAMNVLGTADGTWSECWCLKSPASAQDILEIEISLSSYKSIHFSCLSFFAGDMLLFCKR